MNERGSETFPYHSKIVVLFLELRFIFCKKVMRENLFCFSSDILILLNGEIAWVIYTI